jgi:hypothetical protein
MLKAADALSAEGYEVRVVSTNHDLWARHTDAALRGGRRWRSSIVDYDRTTAPGTYWRSGVRFHASREIARRAGVAHLPWALVTDAYSRVGREIADAILAEPADFVYGGTTGALAAIGEAARRMSVPFGVDFEDLHSGEHDGATADGRLDNGLAARIERRIVAGASFVTTSSDPIAEAYRDMYGVRPVVVCNTFTCSETSADIHDQTQAAGHRPLMLYWFSQTIGPGRGLEDVPAAAALAGIDAELHLRGRVSDAYRRDLLARAASAPRLKLVFHDRVAPGDIVKSCRHYDIGLAIEPSVPEVRNRALCLSNKALTYPLGGLAVVVTDTPGHRTLLADFNGSVRSYTAGDAGALAGILRAWDADRDALAAARAGARRVAMGRWNWDHDRRILVGAVRAALDIREAADA